MFGTKQQATEVTVFRRRPFEGRTRALFLPEADAAGRAGFECAANAAAVASLAFGRFAGGAALEMDDLFLPAGILNHSQVTCSNSNYSTKETCMKKLLSVLVAAVFTIGSVSAIACGDKAKDEKQISTPSKPKV